MSCEAVPAPVPEQAQAQAQARVPEGLSPGQTFNTTTPDGQQVQIPVPEGSEPGSMITYSYVPSGGAVPTVIGQPIMGATVTPGGMLVPVRTPEEQRRMKDKDASTTAWMIYLCGWVSCVLCPFGGIICWFVVACQHYCRPKDQREEMEQEQHVARMSLVTAVVCSVVGIVVVVLALAQYNDIE